MSKREIDPSTVLADVKCRACMKLKWCSFSFGAKVKYEHYKCAELVFCGKCGKIQDVLHDEDAHKIGECFFDYYTFGPGGTDISGFPLSKIKPNSHNRRVNMRLVAIRQMMTL